MTANELADALDVAWPAYMHNVEAKAAAMLRKQAEAIKVLREALAASAVALNIGHNTITALEVSRQALQDTEEFK